MSNTNLSQLQHLKIFYDHSQTDNINIKFKTQHLKMNTKKKRIEIKI